AIPLAGLGALAEAGGETATEISADLWDTANAPLKVDDTIIVPQPMPDLVEPITTDGESNGANQ
ncbi:MAG: hypothetical protein AAFQ15_06350, partial [Pseudomonadota bacterium]